VSEIGHNGSSEGASILPPDPHDEFQELCALSTTGELTPGELARLEEHLSECAACRQSRQEFERFVALVIPALTEEDGIHENNGISPGSWSIEEAEAELMASLRDEPSPGNDVPILRSRLSPLGIVGRYAVQRYFLPASASLAIFSASATKANRSLWLCLFSPLLTMLRLNFPRPTVPEFRKM
jgi:hypothetical protein